MPRPPRRASQTFKHLFKYQLADDPLKMEQEDLKRAILASMQQSCDTIDKRVATKKAKKMLNLVGEAPKRSKRPHAKEEFVENDPKLDTEDFITFICSRSSAAGRGPRRLTTDKDNYCDSGVAVSSSVSIDSPAVDICRDEDDDGDNNAASSPSG